MAELAEKVSIRYPINVHNVAIHEDPFHPSAYVISLPLDSDASYVWQTLFQQELWSSLDFWDRKTIIVGRELKLVTTLDRLEEKLNWLERLVVATNKRVEEYNRKVEVEKEARKSSQTDRETIRKELAKWELGRAPAQR